MRISKMVLAVAAALAASAGSPGTGSGSTLDGYPAVTRYISNDAPFVVFGVAPTRFDGQAGPVKLTFIATDRLEQVNVFPFVRSTPGGSVRMRTQVSCGPRDPGSWDCTVPVAGLLVDLDSSGGELGLRIEAHGELRDSRQHSTVIITMPARRPAAAING